MSQTTTNNAAARLTSQRPVARDMCDSVGLRAAEHYAAQQLRLRQRTDRAFAGLMILQWFFGLTLAWVLSPTTWQGMESTWHPHVYAAVFLGGWLSFLPVYLCVQHAGNPINPFVMAIAQGLWSALLIHLSGGRIETHFHVFGSLAFLSAYRDWRVLLTASGVVVVDHIVRGWLCPEAVYGDSQFVVWRTLEHAGWVVFEDVFLIASCVAATSDARERAGQHAVLEASHDVIADEVKAQTEELQLREAEAKELAVAAQSANQAKSQFLANMSHEIRTPLTAIMGFADMLLEDGDISRAPESRIEAIATIRRNGEHLLSVINDILDLSKIEAGQMTVESLPCDSIQLFSEVLSLLQPRAAQKGLNLNFQFEGQIPRKMQTDPTRLRQILINVIGNSVKFTEQGSVTAIVRCESQSPVRLSVDVTDTGIGMSAEQQKRLFAPFTQADGTMTRRYGGTGLGLTISRKLAHLLGGDLCIASSEPGVGTTMRLTIDAGASADAWLYQPSLLEAVSTISGAKLPEPVAKEALAGKRILLAEDFVPNQKLIAYVLHKAGADVHVVENGHLAVECACAQWRNGQPFDMILMDMQMPVLDGYEATALLRAKGYSGPVIALTAHAMSMERERCLSCGCSDHASKPIDRRELVDSIIRHLRGTSADQPTASEVGPSVHPSAPQEHPIAGHLTRA